MTTTILPLLSDEEYEQHLTNVDAAQILDQVLDLQPLDGWDDEDLYNREDRP
jgi:hypothetical protein